ncbi:MAG: hypothetical protein WA863_09965, partial [Methyloceanibacter sp.]
VSKYQLSAAALSGQGRAVIGASPSLWVPEVSLGRSPTFPTRPPILEFFRKNLNRFMGRSG